MSVKDFLTLVLPDEGYFIVATPFKAEGSTRSAWWNFVVDDLSELQVKCREWLMQKRDVYFALGTFREREVINLNKIDYKTKLPGAKEKRTQANVKWLRCFFIDLDVKPGVKGHYQSQAEALKDLKRFLLATGLPTPVIVSSGYGIHAYWPLTENIEPVTWKATATKLKAACVHAKLLADPAVTADEARVLRVPGTTNFKNGKEEPVTLLRMAPAHAFGGIDAHLERYITSNNVPVDAAKPVLGIPARVGPMASVEGNLGATNDPLNPGALMFSCPAFSQIVANRGATASEPQWRAALGLARFCENEAEMKLAVSDGHPDFSVASMEEKIANMTLGPTKCFRFWEKDNATCEACPNWQIIKSPAVMGRPLRENKPTEAVDTDTGEVTVIPPLPYGYVRVPDKDGMNRIMLREEDDEGKIKDTLVIPYDLYPMRILRKTTEDDDAEERSVWVAILPRSGAFEFTMVQSILSDPRKLHGFLLNRSLHLSPKEAKSAQFYMTAYLRELAKMADGEQTYERLGWHNKNKMFVLPDRIFHADGTMTKHATTRVLDAVTKGAYHTEGTLAEWMRHIGFYSGAGNEPYRTVLYATFGSPLLYMTGHKGILIAASGDTGRGKTTLLEAGASIYGNPEGLLVGGGRYGATMNAMWSILGTNHSLPMFWDDTTDREPEEMREFMLHISTGKGKERMHGNVHDGKVVTWQTMVISSANTDDVHRVMTTGKDSSPHLMRFISIDFDTANRNTDMKIKADAFKRGIRENYGHAGMAYLAYIAQHREEVHKLIIKEMERFDRLLNVKSEERHWTAALACMSVGGRIAYKLGLFPFDPRLDEAWMLQHVRDMRVNYAQATSTAVDILTEFLESNVRTTLILSPKQSSNVDNIVQKPQGALTIRNEVDTKLIYISRTAMNEFCTESKASFRKLENELVASGVLIRKSAYKVLGADTPWSGGQTRCWEIDRDKLEKFTAKKGTP